MWFDAVEKIIDSKTFIIAVHDGSYSGAQRLKHLKLSLLKANIDTVEVLSAKSVQGDRVAKTYDLPSAGGLMILRADKQVAWSWLGVDMPATNELICRFNQVG
jgi:hypothetical protein